MRNGSCRAFVVEGEAREPQIIRNLCNIHFRHSDFRIITLPAGQNIYMLWKTLKKGKLYINYPMVEALRDFMPGLCGGGESCYCNLNQLCDYKHVSAERGIYNDFREYTFEIWREALSVFVMRVSCLFEERSMDYDRYRDTVSPFSVYLSQQKYIKRGGVFVLSAFPQFLPDYFTARFWHACIGRLGEVRCDFKKRVR